MNIDFISSQLSKHTKPNCSGVAVKPGLWTLDWTGLDWTGLDRDFDDHFLLTCNS